MGRILSAWRIIAASAFAVVLIAGAYLLARGTAHPPKVEASEESALLAQIAAKDSDADGLPDWEEALYGTDPHNPDTKHLGITDGEAVAKGLIVPVAIADVPQAAPSASAPADPSLPPPPAQGTMTAAFARDFFTLYLNAKQKKGSAALSTQDTQAIASQALADLASSITLAPPFKRASDLVEAGSGTETMKTYAAAVERVLTSGTANATSSEIVYLKDAIEHDNSDALVPIASIAKSYRVAAAGIAALPVPKELVATDLSLINALARLGEVVQDFTLLESDPLAAILALEQYPQAIQNLGNAFIAVTAGYRAAGVVLPSGTPGASVVNFIPDLAAEQASSSAP